MEVAIVTVWSIGLAGALVATVALAKMIALVLAELSAIRRLAEITREASRGVAKNAAHGSALEPLGNSAQRLREAGRRQSGAVAAAGRKLDAWAGESP